MNWVTCNSIVNLTTFLMRYIISCFLLSLFNLCSYGQTVDPNFVDGQIHLKISSNPGFDLANYTGGNIALDLILNTNSVDSIYKPFPRPSTPLDSIYRVVFSNISAVDNLVSALEVLPFVAFAEKNPMAHLFHTPNDLQSNQWALEKIDAELGWNLSIGNPNVLVAVLDNAIAIDHVDLAANVYTNSAESGGLSLLDDDFNGFADDVNGYDVSDNDNNPRPPGNGDGFAHGTHVAGIVGAVTNNGSGIASLGYSCTILPVKIASNSNGSALNGSIDGIFYAMQSGADVINMSWGVQTDAATLRTVIAQAAADGIVLVAAAGNDGNQNLHYPAAYSEVISVGSTNQNDQLSAFSNFGSTIDLVAPGEGIYSTLPQGNNTYGDLSGTSMAAPLVAALASLVKAEFPSFNRIQIQQRMEQGCDDISAQNPGQNGQYGLGESMFFKP